MPRPRRRDESWSDDVLPNERDKRVIREACPGCRQDRYNRGRGYCENPRFDTPVYCHMCLHVPRVTYNRSLGRYHCIINSSGR